MYDWIDAAYMVFTFLNLVMWTGMYSAALRRESDYVTFVRTCDLVTDIPVS